MTETNATRAAGSSAPACSADEWRNVAFAALTLASELVAELRRKCPDSLHVTQAAQIAELLKQCTPNRQSSNERTGRMGS
jgi:hypothetical protein